MSVIVSQESIQSTPFPLSKKGAASKSAVSLQDRINVQELLSRFPNNPQEMIAFILPSFSDRVETKVFFKGLLQMNVFSDKEVFDIFKSLILKNEEDLVIHCLPFLKNVNFQDQQGCSLLHLAVQQGLEKLSLQLLKKHTDPLLKDINQNCAFNDEFVPGGMIYGLIEQSIKNEDELTTLQLLDLSAKTGHNFDVNHRLQSGNTLLHLAAENALQDVLFALLLKGADPAIKNKHGAMGIDNEDLMPGGFIYGVLEIAIVKGEQKIAIDLLKLVNKKDSAFQVDSPVSSKKITLLQLAIQYSRADIGYQLLSMRAKLNDANGLSIFEKCAKEQKPFTYNLIILALKNNHDAQAVFLLNHFQNLNSNFIQGAIGESGKTLLHVCCDLEKLQFAIELLALGINFNTKDKEDWTALDYLAGRNQSEIQIEKLLVNKGATSQVMSAKILAHIWGIEDNGQLGNQTFEYGGSSVYPMTKQIAKYGTAFLTSPWLANLKTSTDWLKDENFEDVVQMLGHLSTNLEEDPQNIVKQSSFGLMTEWNDHSTAIASDGKLLIKCDRGGGDEELNGIQIFKMNQAKNLPDAIQMLQTDKGTEKEGETFFEKGIDKVLDLQPIMTIKQKQQAAENCTWASGQALMLALLTLHFLNGRELKEAVACAQFVYKHWNIYTKIESVKSYFSEPGVIDTSNPESPKLNIDMNLFSAILKKIETLQERKSQVWDLIGNEIGSFVNEFFKSAGIK